MASQDVRFVMAVDDQGFIRKMTEAERALYETKKEAEKTKTVFSQLFKGFVSGQIAVDIIRRGLRGLANEFKSTVGEAMQQESADRALQAALELTGREVERNAKYYHDYASALQSATVYADDQIQAVQTLLLQMTSLSRDGIDRATRGTIGLASTMKMDLFSAAQLVQKALEGNFGALSRYGIRVDETLSLEEKRVQLLGKLEVMFGRAQAETETFEGKLKQLNNAWGDFKEKVGAAVTQGSLFQNLIASLTSTLETLTRAAEPLPEQLSFWEKLASGVSGAIGPIVQAAAMTKKWSDETWVAADAWRQLQNVVLTSRRAAIDPIAETIVVVTHKMQALTAGTKDARDAFRAMADAALEMVMPLDLMEAAYDMFPTEEEIGVPDFLQAYIDAARGAAGQTRKQTTRMTDMWAGFMNNISSGFASAFSQFSLTLEGFKNYFVGIWEAIKNAFFQIIGQMIAKWLVFKVILPFINPSGSILGALGGGLIPLQHGFEGVISRPTPILVGEAGPEYVSVRPMSRGSGGGGGATINVNIYSWDNASMESAVRHRVVPILQEVMAHGDL